MEQVNHIQNNKHTLILRSEIIRHIREFFWDEGFFEVETPNLVRLPGQEPYLSPMQVQVENEKGDLHPAYLHTSPEYGMKKMLAAGFENIFSICKCYRNNESFGGQHNPEFTMLEWYRAGVRFRKIVEDFQFLWASLLDAFPECAKHVKHLVETSVFETVHMRDVWARHADVQLDDYLTTEAMQQLCKEKGYAPKEDESYEDVFFRIFLNEIEPHLGKKCISVVYGYPAQMAALAELSEGDARYADRFEIYIGGVEVANGFTELTDAKEQRRRLEEERALREQLGKDVYDIDEEFLAAVANMPKSSGVALGVDRLVMLLAGCQDIDSVLALPASKLF